MKESTYRELEDLADDLEQEVGLDFTTTRVFLWGAEAGYKKGQDDFFKDFTMIFFVSYFVIAFLLMGIFYGSENNGRFLGDPIMPLICGLFWPAFILIGIGINIGCKIVSRRKNEN